MYGKKDYSKLEKIAKARGVGVDDLIN